jgi:PBP1b-binding outer membrane lipoprotein LpoB
MKAKLSFLLTAVLFTFIINGCTASMNDVLQEKNEGTAKTYSVTPDQAWEIAVTVLRWEDCEMIEEHRMSGYMLTKIDNESILWREESLIGVWVDSLNTDKTKVTVVTKRKHKTAAVTGLTETTFHETFANAVNIVKKGQKLPIAKP